MGEMGVTYVGKSQDLNRPSQTKLLFVSFFLWKVNSGRLGLRVGVSGGH